MVVEQPGVPYVAGEDLHRLMVADLLNFSDVRSGARGRRDEARAEAVARITFRIEPARERTCLNYARNGTATVAPSPSWSVLERRMATRTPFGSQARSPTSRATSVDFPFV